MLHYPAIYSEVYSDTAHVCHMLGTYTYLCRRANEEAKRLRNLDHGFRKVTGEHRTKEKTPTATKLNSYRFLKDMFFHVSLHKETCYYTGMKNILGLVLSTSRKGFQTEKNC